jgi:phosphatidylglycerophosphate synthase
MREPKPGTALVYVPGGVDPGARFTGRSLVERALAVAAAAGLDPALVAPDGPVRLAAAVATPTLRPGDPLPSSGAVVLLRCDAACVAGAVRDLLAATTPRAVLDDQGRVALVATSAAALGGRVPPGLETAARGVVLEPRAGWLGRRRVLALPHAGVAGDPRAAHAARVRAERELISSLDNPRDGFADGLLNRHLSRPLSRALMQLPVTPNQITVAGLLLSLAAAALIALPGVWWPVLGALLLQATAVLDCVDGEIARAKVLETEWGEWLDITSDTVIHVATFLGIAVHAWPELGRDTAWLLGALFACGGLAAFAVVTRAEKTEDRWKPLGVWQSRLLGMLLATLTTRDLSVLVLAAAASGLLTELLVGAAIGAQAFWIGTLLLLTRVLRLAGEASPDH